MLNRARDRHGVILLTFLFLKGRFMFGGTEKIGGASAGLWRKLTVMGPPTYFRGAYRRLDPDLERRAGALWDLLARPGY